MKQKRHPTEEVIKKLREAEALIAAGPWKTRELHFHKFQVLLDHLPKIID